MLTICRFRDHENKGNDQEFRAATEQFQRYVECRWPIHVFNVDPVNEDQNVQESSRLSRELVIAAALGVSSGTLNFRQANQFVRQYQESINTIGLNRTISGFSHGSDTFGWSFRPRIQTHKPRGTVATFGETLLGRRADANLRSAAIEPGMRECTAIVLMPSFVPYCDFDISTDWFRLDNPRSTELSTHATMKLSRSIKQMQDCALQCVQYEHLYRDGVTKRLMNRVSQLERQLPLQSMRVQIPYENTLGGFELFSNGVTDLAPELVGWYGAPGIRIGAADGCCPGSCGGTDEEQAICKNPDGTDAEEAACSAGGVAANAQGNGTSIFLVGDNFSVHETRIIAGGVEVPREHMHMISRQVIQINVPACASKVTLDEMSFVAIYAATPYGVTSHLHVPVVEHPKAADVNSAAITTQLEEASKDLATAVARLDMVEKATMPYRWTAPSSLPIASNFVKENGNNEIFRKELEVANIPPTTKINLDWTKTPTSLIAPVSRQAGLIGAFEFNGKTVGKTFWIVPPGEIDLNGGKLELTAEKMTEFLEPNITNQLKMDLTGKVATAEIKLSTWIVPVQADMMGSFAAIGQPQATDKQLTINLVERVNPNACELCKPDEAESTGVLTPAIPVVPTSGHTQRQSSGSRVSHIKTDMNQNTGCEMREVTAKLRTGGGASGQSSRRAIFVR